MEYNGKIPRWDRREIARRITPLYEITYDLEKYLRDKYLLVGNIHKSIKTYIIIEIFRFKNKSCDKE